MEESRQMTEFKKGTAELSHDLMFLFNCGENYKSYNILGAHVVAEVGAIGCCFSVWAPNAKSVSVVCDLNGWDRTKNPMKKYPDTGIWTCFVCDVGYGENYKFSIETTEGDIILKADPFAFASQVRPDTASRTVDMSYHWGDGQWMKKREKTAPYDRPMNIYELHFGSWQRGEDGEMLTYSQMAEQLIPYVKEMGIPILRLCLSANTPLTAHGDIRLRAITAQTAVTAPRGS